MRFSHGGHEVLEGTVRGGHRDPAPEAFVSQLEHRAGQLGRIDEITVVDDHPYPARNAYPESVDVAEGSRDQGGNLVADGSEPALAGQEPDRARTLGDEDVGRATIAFLVDQKGEIGRLAVANLHVDPGMVDEGLEEGSDQVGGTARVDRYHVVRTPA